MILNISQFLCIQLLKRGTINEYGNVARSSNLGDLCINVCAAFLCPPAHLPRHLWLNLLPFLKGVASYPKWTRAPSIPGYFGLFPGIPRSFCTCDPGTRCGKAPRSPWRSGSSSRGGARPPNRSETKCHLAKTYI